MNKYNLDNGDVKMCDECNGVMRKVKMDINLKCGSKMLTIRGVDGYRCDDCENEIIYDKEFEMIENLFNSLNKPEIDILNLEETADLLRVSNQTVYNMIKANRLKAYKIGREWKFMRSDIELYLNGVSTNSSWGAAAKGGKISKEDMEIIQREAAKRKHD